MICLICKVHEAQESKHICEQCEDSINSLYDKEDDTHAIEN